MNAAHISFKFCIISDNCTEIKDDDTLITKDLLFMDPEKDHHVDHVFKA